MSAVFASSAANSTTKSAVPDLKRYLDKRVSLKLNAGRRVNGVLRGYDAFLNLVLEDADEIVSADEMNKIGLAVLRGSSVLQVELLE